jgi:phage tail sheath protein FI
MRCTCFTKNASTGSTQRAAVVAQDRDSMAPEEGYQVVSVAHEFFSARSRALLVPGLAWTGSNFIIVRVTGRHRSRFDPRKLSVIRAGPEL